MSGLTVESISGAAIEPYLEDLAALRIEVFREFPYLYEGTLEYESHYLRNYANAQNSLVVIARDGDQVVGASTALPLTDHTEDVAPTFVAAGIDPARVYYFGESVLRASYRGRRIGHAFFDAREARAAELGYDITSFCAVERPAAHPLRPANYVPHDAFWTKRGYAKRPDLHTTFAWLDIGEHAETDKPMIFWIRERRKV